MKVYKISEFIKEEFQDPPEEYIKTALIKIKKKIESFFEESQNDRDNMEVDFAPEKEKDKSIMTLEHTHPPASLVLHGNRNAIQGQIKSNWFNKLTTNA